MPWKIVRCAWKSVILRRHCTRELTAVARFVKHPWGVAAVITESSGAIVDVPEAFGFDEAFGSPVACYPIWKSLTVQVGQVAERLSNQKLVSRILTMAEKRRTKKKIIITADDHRRLEALLASHVTQALADKPYLTDLRHELRIADIVDQVCLPSDVVTMNSTVRLRELGNDDSEVYTLVYPRDANIAAGKLSILAPIGTAILGYRTGDIVQWRVPHGSVRIVIDEVICQPEKERMLY